MQWIVINFFWCFLTKKGFQVLKCSFSQQICEIFVRPIEIFTTFANVIGTAFGYVPIPEKDDNRNR